MHTRLWAAQIVVGLFFIVIGVLHLVVPDNLPGQLEWMYDLSENLHYLTGVAEILGGLGLILPGLTRRWTWLTPLAATGLILLMAGAIVWHLGREEFTNVATNVILVLALSFIAYGRWRAHPLPQ